MEAQTGDLERPLREGKGHIYEGGIREPFIVKWPGVKPRVDDTPVCSDRLSPDACRCSRRSFEPMHSNIDGVSLVSLIRDRKPLAERPSLLALSALQQPIGQTGRGSSAGRLQTRGTLREQSSGVVQPAKDIGEKNNLADKMPDKTKQLHAMLKDWRASVGAQMPTPNPNYDPKREDFGYWWRTGTQPK